MMTGAAPTMPADSASAFASSRLKRLGRFGLFGRDVGPGEGRGDGADAGGRQPEERGVDQRLPVDRLGHGHACLRVVPGRPAVIHGQPVPARAGDLDQGEVGIVGDLRHADGRDDVEHIDVARFQGADAAGGLGNDRDLDGVEVRPPAVPALEGDQLEAAAQVGAVGHDGEGAAPTGVWSNCSSPISSKARCEIGVRARPGPRLAATARNGANGALRVKVTVRVVGSIDRFDQGQLVGMGRGEIGVDGALVGVRRCPRP